MGSSVTVAELMEAITECGEHGTYNVMCGIMKPPTRIQRRRIKGWVTPPHTVYVGRPSRWGNPFYIGTANSKDEYACATAKEAVSKYANMMVSYRHPAPNNGLDKFYISLANIQSIQYELRGKNLSCWCALDQPCHADVLLEIANGEEVIA